MKDITITGKTVERVVLGCLINAGLLAIGITGCILLAMWANAHYNVIITIIGGN
jgi:hypothetical protein